MRIIPADELRPRLTPHPQTPGVFFLEWCGELLALVDERQTPVQAAEADRNVGRMDQAFPVRSIPWTDDLDVLCLPYQLAFLSASGTPTQQPQGMERSGLVALSPGLTGPDLWEVQTHELTHSWTRWAGMPVDGEADPKRLAEMCAITGIDPDEFDSTAFLWSRRWQELLAEHLSAALWDAPLAMRSDALRPTDTIPPLTPGQYVRLAQWARRITPRHRTIALEIGNPIATVDGRAVTLDAPAMLIPPGRTMVPLRFVAEALGCRVDWDGDTQTVTITQEVPAS